MCLYVCPIAEGSVYSWGLLFTQTQPTAELSTGNAGVMSMASSPPGASVVTEATKFVVVDTTAPCGYEYMVLANTSVGAETAGAME